MHARRKPWPIACRRDGKRGESKSVRQLGEPVRPHPARRRPPAWARPRPLFDKKTIAAFTISTARCRRAPCRTTPSCRRSARTPLPSGRNQNRSRAEGADALITYMHLLYKKAKAKGASIAPTSSGRAEVELLPGGRSGSTRSPT